MTGPGPLGASLAALALATACAPTPPEQPQLVLLAPYRAAADPCRLAGETAATAAFLDDSADLVACPAGMENLGVFATETGGREVGRVAGHVLYSVPRR